MRDLIYKNLTSEDKRKRIVATSEIVDKEGVHSIIRRHFICIIREVQDVAVKGQAPYVYILKKRNTKSRCEEFFCRIKGNIFAVSNGKLFLILFMHSLKINLSVASHFPVG